MTVADLKDKGFWYSEDIQMSLDYLNSHPLQKQKLISYLESLNTNDSATIIYCINEGFAENFENFDSDLTEQYIAVFIKIIL